MANEQVGKLRGDARKILLVEDDPMIRNSLEWVLPALGYQVLPFETGEQALQGIPIEERADFRHLIVDLSLPGMRGEVFTRDWLQSLPDAVHARPTVLFCSGLQEGELRLAASAISDLISDERIQFLRKPFRIGELERLLAVGREEGVDIKSA